MLKLFKLAVFGMVGYAIYEFVSGLLESRTLASGRGGVQPLQSRPRQSRRGPIMTGNQGEGELVPVSDSSGVERRERVGRGVMSSRGRMPR